MMPRSFTLRLALISTLLSGAVLVLFAVWGLTLVRQSALARLDDELDATAERHLSGPPHEPRPWDQIARNLDEASAIQGATAILVLDEIGGTIYRSAQWPPSLRPDAFPLPDPGQYPPQPPPRPPHDEFRRQDRSPPPPPDREPGFGQGRRGPGDPPWPGLEQPRGDRPGPPRGAPRPSQVSEAVYRTWIDGESTWRVVSMTNRHTMLAVGRNLDVLDAQMRALHFRFGASAVGALVLMAVAGWVVARRALRPVHALTATAESITAKALHERIAVNRADAEFARLIDVFNGMLARLETSFAQATRFSADSAHELNTPLTILQGELERGIQGSADGSEDQRRYGKLLEEVQRLRSIVRKLLLLSLADSGQLKLNREAVNVTAMLESAVDDARILFSGLRVDIEPGDVVTVPADSTLLQQVVQNLLINACKYNMPGGKVKCRLRTTDDVLELSIVNTGPSIPSQDQPRIFDRFYRVDMARSRAEGGTGLGLSLSREIARAHGGELVLVKSDERGTEFRLTLPTMVSVSIASS